jgi:excisionase family DNA binding protein
MGMRRIVARLQESEQHPLFLSDVAAALGCSKKYLYKCIDNDLLRAGRIGRDFRVEMEEAVRFAREAGFLRE